MWTWILTIFAFHPGASHANLHSAVDPEVYKVIDQPAQKSIQFWLHEESMALDDDEIDPAALLAGEISSDDDFDCGDCGLLQDRARETLKISDHALPPLKGSVLLRYHDPHKTQHEGIDIRVRDLSPVRAIWPGEVEYAQCSDGKGGCIVTLRHSNGLTTYYSHLNGTPSVRRGDMVSQAQILGQVGGPGRLTQSHLHFEVRSGRRPINPLNYIRP